MASPNITLLSKSDLLINKKQLDLSWRIKWIEKKEENDSKE